MRRLLILILTLSGLATQAQTVIDLRRGGATVHAKNHNDYQRQLRTPEQLRQDSLEYIDCLTRGYNHLHLDSLAAARKSFERALRLRPDAPATFILHRELGKIALAEGKFAESIGHFDHTLRLQPTDQEARFQRATCHIALQHPQQALDDCQTLFLHATDATTAIRILLLQSAAHQQLRQYPQVEADLMQILRMDPLHTGAQLLYAMNLEDLGQPQEALNRLNIYIHAHPTDAEALTARSRLHHKQRNLIQACEDLNEAISLLPSDASLYLQRAKIFDEMGEKRRAAADRQRATQLSRSR